MITLFGHTKGGVGKSTLALNYAIWNQMQGRDTLMVDTDPKQRSVCKALASRPGDLFAVECVELGDAEAIQKQVPLLARRYIDTVIDAGGKDGKAFRAAMLMSDRVFMPVSPDSVELWAVQEMLDIMGEIAAINPALTLTAILNRGKSRGTTNDAAKEALRGLGVTVIDATIVQRDAYSSAFSYGQSVLEYRPRDKKAADEVMMVFSQLNEMTIAS